MRQITINAYKFSELSDEAKKNAIKEYRKDQYLDDVWNIYGYKTTLNAFCQAFRCKFDRYQNVSFTPPDYDTVTEDLKGIRLMKYIINNFYDSLFTKKYLGCIDREVRHKMTKVNNGQNGKYSFIYSNIQLDNCCTLTGIGTDNDILQPIYDFLENPNNSDTIESLFEDCYNSLIKAYDNEIEYRQSDEYIIEEIELNEYEFDENGKLI